MDEPRAEEQSRLVDQLAGRVVERRLETAATLFLEMHKPIAFLGGQALYAAAPILGTLFGYEHMQRLAAFMERPENVEELLLRIEEMCRERDSARSDAPAVKGVSENS